MGFRGYNRRVRFMVPTFTYVIIMFKLVGGIPMFSIFVSKTGRKMGLLCGVTPAVVKLIFTISLLRSDKTVSTVYTLVRPATRFLKFPGRVIPLMLLHPISKDNSATLLATLCGAYNPSDFTNEATSILTNSDRAAFCTVTVCFNYVHIGGVHRALFTTVATSLATTVVDIVAIEL